MDSKRIWKNPTTAAASLAITGITTDTIWRKIRSGVLPAWGAAPLFSCR